MALRLDMAEIATDVVVGAGSGAVQRLLWDNPNNMFGWLGTGGFILGGLLLRGMTGGNRMMDRALDVAYISGLSTAGWVATDMLFLGKKALPAQAPPYAPRYGINSPSEARRQAQLGSGQMANSAAGLNGVSGPRASTLGVNPETGHRILGSQI